MAYLEPGDIRDRVPKAKTWDADIIEELVAEFEERVEDHLGVAYEPREATYTVDVSPYASAVVLPHVKIREITAVTVDDTEWTEDEISDLTPDLEAGVIPWTTCGVAVFAYGHGFDEPTPAVKRACRNFVRAKYVYETSERSRNVTSVDDQSGTTYDYAVTTPTGVPEADRIIATLTSYRVPGVA